MSQSQLAQRAATLLSSKVDSLPKLPVTIGLDGFVDSIIRVVDKRESTTKFKQLPTLAALGERISRAAGMSTQIELWVERVKLGGNGPIMANAMAALGTPTTYIGNLGYPHIHPAFEELTKRATVLSIADPSSTDARISAATWPTTSLSIPAILMVFFSTVSTILSEIGSRTGSA